MDAVGCHALRRTDSGRPAVPQVAALQARSQLLGGRSGRDLAIVAAVALAAFALASRHEIGEAFGTWAADNEHWQADELPFSLIALCAALVWFAWRRWCEVRALQQRNQALARHLLQAQENERRLLARDLHDELGQHCAAIRVEAECLLGGLRRPVPDLAAVSAGAAAVAGNAEALQREVRRMLRRLRPPALETLGLAAATGSLVDEWRRRHGIAASLSCDSLGVLPDEVATAAYRVVQEALTNVARHAQASAVRVSLRRAGDRLHIEVADDGVGFAGAAGSAATSGGGFGLVGMAERIADFGGLLKLDGGRGVSVRAEIPLASRSAA